MTAQCMMKSLRPSPSVYAYWQYWSSDEEASVPSWRVYIFIPYPTCSSPLIPQIKILKRQTDSTSNAEPASNVTTAVVGKQHKTLAEREAEYASARYV